MAAARHLSSAEMPAGADPYSSDFAGLSFALPYPTTWLLRAVRRGEQNASVTS
jgi:hypothetical protein